MSPAFLGGEPAYEGQRWDANSNARTKPECRRIDRKFGAATTGLASKEALKIAAIGGVSARLTDDAILLSLSAALERVDDNADEFAPVTHEQQPTALWHRR